LKIINFDKMQALGNDFVMIAKTQMTGLEDIGDFCRKISHRTLGIGCDLVTFYSNDTSVIDASFFNADGSETEICGNATRCLGLLAKMRQLDMKSILLKTKNSSYVLHMKKDNDVSINFGKPTALTLAAHVSDPMNLSLSEDLRLDNGLHDELRRLGLRRASCLSVGNPHLVLLLEHMPSLDQAQRIGSILESNPLFPNKVNVSFGKIISENAIALLVFERADGLTYACGSGAMATAVAIHKNNFLSSNAIVVTQRGGSLLMQLDKNGDWLQTGSATHVFSGQYRFATENVSTNTSTDASTENSAVIVYTDGACSGNPGPGGWAALIMYDGQEQELCGSDDNTTNNRMEMMAAIAALELFLSPRSIALHTDSTYVKNGITKWIHGWLKNNWVNSEHEPVKNKDLWQRLLKATKFHKVSWNWVHGHSGNKFNERVDKLAKKQCRR
jgi:ribonuclease HI